MSSDPSARRILPQNPQMSSFTFAPQQFPQQRETQKNYVFVDEHNRHKRLKVMRACEGCRRRKIKCDAATTNTWPCSACIRLKLHCVRPNGYDDGSSYETTSQDFASSAASLQDSLRQQTPAQPQSMLGDASKAGTSVYQHQVYSASDSNLYQPVQYSDSPLSQHNLNYTTVPAPIAALDQQYVTQNFFQTPSLHQGSQSAHSPDSYPQSNYSQSDLADLLGSLRVNEAGTAPYLRNKASFRHEEEPAFDDGDEFHVVLPPTRPGKIRIPPVLMPEDSTILNYFDMYFDQVHPYIPVLSKSIFYQQWDTNRESISPLILEAIFAIGGRLADEAAQGQQWLALASKHADSFMDVPRLSTLQALIIIMKAREAAPQRGYYYRSWMSVVQCVQMGKDLGLDEHYSDHIAGRGCESTPEECQMKTRIWLTTFVLETMIGGPQGRTDLSVEIDSVDFSVPAPVPGGDDSEYLTFRNFIYFSRVVRNVSRMNTMMARVRKKKKEWGIDPEFVQLNPSISAWLTELPADLAVTYPPDGSAPWLASPFIGNLHSYHYLTFILLHRPQLAFCDPSGLDGKWKQHMLTCYSSAKALCRLQEGVLDQFGIPGLQNMLRGLSFPVYCALSCTVLHLVAMTSPDPDLNTDSRDYFTRHMRILEKVMAAWPMPEMQKQVDAVREAFSADVRKPFVLKPSFPYGSPSSSHSSPPHSSTGYRPVLDHANSTDSQLPHAGFTSQAISPPVSTGPLDSKDGSPLLMLATGHPSHASGLQDGLPMPETSSWNPSRIFEQWNTSFGPPPVATTTAGQHGGSIPVVQASDTSGLSNYQDLQAAVTASMPAVSHQMPVQDYSAVTVPNFITPAMWQQSVASVYEGGLKRAWDYEGGPVKRR